MSDQLKRLSLICTTIVICAIIMGLVLISITHDGTVEGEIVIALIGFASTILAAGSALGGHWQGTNSAQQIIQQQQQTPTPNP